MSKIRSRFTKWYIKRGYEFEFNPFDDPQTVFTCPIWVRPLLIFFSPSVYEYETLAKGYAEWLERGLRAEMKPVDDFAAFTEFANIAGKIGISSNELRRYLSND